MGPDGNDSPAHPVLLTQGFYLGKYEVTQAQWFAITSDSPSTSTGDGNPVETVSWDERSNC